MVVDVLGAVILLGLSALVVAVIWQDKMNQLGLTMWQVYWRTMASVGVMALIIEFIAKPLGLGGW